jgi:hypothetical protein
MMIFSFKKDFVISVDSIMVLLSKRKDPDP